MKLHETQTITFENESAFKKAVEPYDSQQVSEFLKNNYNMKVAFDPSLGNRKVEVIPLHTSLLHHEVFKNDLFSIYYPKSPRVPHQLSIAFCERIKHFDDLQTKDLETVLETIQKIDHLYSTQFKISGFVLAQYMTPQARHNNQLVFEFLPHQPGYESTRDFLDKLDSNRHVLFNDQNFTPLSINHSFEEQSSEIAFWQSALAKEDKPQIDNLPTSFPIERKDSSFEVAKELLKHHLLQYFENAGAQLEHKPLSSWSFNDQAKFDPKIYETTNCTFCNPTILERQKVFEYNDIIVLYNYRKMAHEATSFLILPKRHIEKVSSLSPDEFKTMHLLKSLLSEVLKEKYPQFETVIYNQGGASVGQTVPHTHDQIVAIDPDRIAFHWTMLSLTYSNSNSKSIQVSNQEMSDVTQEIGALMEQKLKLSLSKEKGLESAA